jgi:hypothetical protein
MAPRNREAIYDALVVYLNNGLANTQDIAANPPVVQRGLKHWNDVPASDMPVIFLPNGNEESQVIGRGTGLPNLWLVKPSLWVYTHTQAMPNYPAIEASDTTSAALMNFILDSLDALLIPDGNAERVTLGGLVQSVRIGGAVESDEGYFGPLSLARIPLEIRAV